MRGKMKGRKGKRGKGERERQRKEKDRERERKREGEGERASWVVFRFFLNTILIQWWASRMTQDL